MVRTSSVPPDCASIDRFTVQEVGKSTEPEVPLTFVFDPFVRTVPVLFRLPESDWFAFIEMLWLIEESTGIVTEPFLTWNRAFLDHGATAVLGARPLREGRRGGQREQRYTHVG